MPGPNTPFTIADAKQWSADNAAELDASRLSSGEEITQMFNRMMPDKSKELWDSGCWLEEQLASRGASREQIQQIQMAAGQRAFGGDAWQAAVDYANEYFATGDTKEKGGWELAKKRNEELFGSDRSDG